MPVCVRRSTVTCRWETTLHTHILHVPQPGHALRQAPCPRPQPACRRRGGSLQLRRRRIIQPPRQLLAKVWVWECRGAGWMGSGGGRGCWVPRPQAAAASRRRRLGLLLPSRKLLPVRPCPIYDSSQRFASSDQPLGRQRPAPARQHEGRVSRMRPRPASSPGQQCAATPPPRCHRQIGRTATTPCLQPLRRLFCVVGRSQSLWRHNDAIANGSVPIEEPRARPSHCPRCRRSAWSAAACISQVQLASLMAKSNRP